MDKTTAKMHFSLHSNVLWFGQLKYDIGFSTWSCIGDNTASVPKLPTSVYRMNTQHSPNCTPGLERYSTHSSCGKMPSHIRHSSRTIEFNPLIHQWFFDFRKNSNEPTVISTKAKTKTDVCEPLRSMSLCNYVDLFGVCDHTFVESFILQWFTQNRVDHSSSSSP